MAKLENILTSRSSEVSMNFSDSDSTQIFTLASGVTTTLTVATTFTKAVVYSTGPVLVSEYTLPTPTGAPSQTTNPVKKINEIGVIDLTAQGSIFVGSLTDSTETVIVALYTAT